MKSSAIKVASSSVAASSSGKVYQFHLPYSSTPSSQRGFTPSNSGVNTNTNGSSTKMPAKMGWLRHVLTILSVVIFVSCLCTTLLHITQLSGAYKKTISCQQKTTSSKNKCKIGIFEGKFVTENVVFKVLQQKNSSQTTLSMP